MTKSNTEKNDWLNMNEKFIAIFFFILKISKTNMENKTDLIGMKVYDHIFLILKITKSNTEKKTGKFEKYHQV